MRKSQLAGQIINDNLRFRPNGYDVLMPSFGYKIHSYINRCKEPVSFLVVMTESETKTNINIIFIN